MAYYKPEKANELAARLMRVAAVSMWRRPSKHGKSGFVYYVFIP